MAENYSEYLRRCELFRSLSQASLDLLGAGCRIKVLDAKQPLFYQDDPGGTLFVVLNGQVSVERTIEGLERDEVIQIALRGEGEVIGEMSIFEEIPRTADVRTTVKSRFLVLEGRYLMQCIQRDSHLAMNVIRSLSEKLREAMERREWDKKPVRTKLAKAIYDLAREFGQRQDNGDIRIETKVNQSDLANTAGCRREVANRTFADIGVDVVSFAKGVITIHDWPRLKREAGISRRTPNRALVGDTEIPLNRS